MTTKEIVHATITGIVLCLIIIFIAYGIASCSKKEAESPYTTTITVASERDFFVSDGDRKIMANIEINSEYSFVDYQIDYDNDRIIINLKKENTVPVEAEGSNNESNKNVLW